MKNFVEGFQRHSERIISCQIKLKGESLKVIQVYAPTSDYEDTEIEAFYEDLAKAMEMKGRGNIIIMGDFNAKIGTKKKEEDLECIGCHGIGERNERGQRLLDFAAENKLYITNTFYQEPKSRYWTWESPGQQYRNQIDFILSTDKSLFKNTEVITSIDVGSDHRMFLKTPGTAAKTRKTFEEQEVIKCLNEMSKNKAPGPDEITSDIIRIGGAPAISYLTKALNQILTLKEIPPSWKEAKIIILYKKGGPGDIANYRPISLLSHSYKIFTRLIQKRMERILDENQPRDQAGFRKAFSTNDHMHTLSQIIEKSNEYNLQLCLGFIDYEKAFDSVEHFAIFDPLRKININENYIQILENIYKNATARLHIDNLISEPFPNRGVRQGDPMSLKLFTAAIEETFKKKSELSNGINIDGEILTNLRFADDVALLTESTPLMEEQLNTLNIKNKEVGLKMHKRKTKFMKNYENDDTIQIENASIEKVQKYKYLVKSTCMKDLTKEKVDIRIRAGWSCFGRNREIFLDKNMPLSLKKQVYDQYILPTVTYGCQTWSLTKIIGNKLKVAQRAMERNFRN
ncbi:endonuclease-reverse transcriptase [Elysia marginata]|uniref:Endonuclease-reverse transcriptase n=1 Tax=Elysia marginata TaxID=1093978 RepID=A0AAV4ID87_9GAST|nr:endonuclease-reverse transcriptase [Elysia marginata]